jgi:hypothetical protein
MEELDRLAADFAARGFEPDGADLDAGASHHHAHDDATASHAHGAGARRFTHRGHEVTIVTHYQVTIDGEPWDQHVGVLDDGSVVYHGLPQYAVPSAVDLIRAVIDYEEDAPAELRDAFRAAREEA